jgi:hypothetical protein
MRTPPPEYGESFFRWLRDTQEEAVVGFADHDPVSPEALCALEQSFKLPIPEDLHVFYRFCNPWGLWGEAGVGIWFKVRKRIEAKVPEATELLPLDVRSMQGNHTAVWLRSPSEYVVVEIKRDSQCCFSDTIRSYFVEACIEEDVCWPGMSSGKGSA